MTLRLSLTTLEKNYPQPATSQSPSLCYSVTVITSFKHTYSSLFIFIIFLTLPWFSS